MTTLLYDSFFFFLFFTHIFSSLSFSVSKIYTDSIFTTVFFSPFFHFLNFFCQYFFKMWLLLTVCCCCYSNVIRKKNILLLCMYQYNILIEPTWNRSLKLFLFFFLKIKKKSIKRMHVKLICVRLHLKFFQSIQTRTHAKMNRVFVFTKFIDSKKYIIHFHWIFFLKSS